MKGYTIPKKQYATQEEGNRHPVTSTREKSDLFNIIKHSCLDDHTIPRYWKVRSTSVIRCADWSEKFHQKRLELRHILKHDPRVTYAYGLVWKDSLADKICENRTFKLHEATCRIGDVEKGAILFYHPDVLTAWAKRHRYENPSLIIYKIFRGRSKVIPPRSSTATKPFDPTPNYECHALKEGARLTDDLEDQIKKSQIFLYEYDDNYLLQKHPRHCLPYAVVCLQRDRSIPARSSNQPVTAPSSDATLPQPLWLQEVTTTQRLKHLEKAERMKSPENNTAVSDNSSAEQQSESEKSGEEYEDYDSGNESPSDFIDVLPNGDLAFDDEEQEPSDEHLDNIVPGTEVAVESTNSSAHNARIESAIGVDGQTLDKESGDHPNQVDLESANSADKTQRTESTIDVVRQKLENGNDTNDEASDDVQGENTKPESSDSEVSEEETTDHIENAKSESGDKQTDQIENTNSQSSDSEVSESESSDSEVGDKETDHVENAESESSNNKVGVKERTDQVENEKSESSDSEVSESESSNSEVGEKETTDRVKNANSDSSNKDKTDCRVENDNSKSSDSEVSESESSDSEGSDKERTDLVENAKSKSSHNKVSIKERTDQVENAKSLSSDSEVGESESSDSEIGDKDTTDHIENAKSESSNSEVSESESSDSEIGDKETIDHIENAKSESNDNKVGDKERTDQVGNAKSESSDSSESESSDSEVGDKETTDHKENAKCDSSDSEVSESDKETTDHIENAKSESSDNEVGDKEGIDHKEIAESESSDIEVGDKERTDKVGNAKSESSDSEVDENESSDSEIDDNERTDHVENAKSKSSNNKVGGKKRTEQVENAKSESSDSEDSEKESSDSEVSDKETDHVENAKSESSDSEANDKGTTAHKENAKSDSRDNEVGDKEQTDQVENVKSESSDSSESESSDSEVGDKERTDKVGNAKSESSGSEVNESESNDSEIDDNERTDHIENAKSESSNTKVGGKERTEEVENTISESNNSEGSESESSDSEVSESESSESEVNDKQTTAHKENGKSDSRDTEVGDKERTDQVKNAASESNNGSERESSDSEVSDIERTDQVENAKSESSNGNESDSSDSEVGDIEITDHVENAESESSKVCDMETENAKGGSSDSEVGDKETIDCQVENARSESSDSDVDKQTTDRQVENAKSESSDSEVCDKERTDRPVENTKSQSSDSEISESESSDREVSDKERIEFQIENAKSGSSDSVVGDKEKTDRQVENTRSESSDSKVCDKERTNRQVENTKSVSSNSEINVVDQACDKVASNYEVGMQSYDKPGNNVHEGDSKSSDSRVTNSVPCDEMSGPNLSGNEDAANHNDTTSCSSLTPSEDEHSASDNDQQNGQKKVYIDTDGVIDKSKQNLSTLHSSDSNCKTIGKNRNSTLCPETTQIEVRKPKKLTPPITKASSSIVKRSTHTPKKLSPPVAVFTKQLEHKNKKFMSRGQRLEIAKRRRMSQNLSSRDSSDDESHNENEKPKEAGLKKLTITKKSRVWLSKKLETTKSNSIPVSTTESSKLNEKDLNNICGSSKQVNVPVQVQMDISERPKPKKFKTKKEFAGKLSDKCEISKSKKRSVSSMETSKTIEKDSNSASSKQADDGTHVKVKIEVLEKPKTLHSAQKTFSPEPTKTNSVIITDKDTERALHSTQKKLVPEPSKTTSKSEIATEKTTEILQPPKVGIKVEKSDNEDKPKLKDSGVMDVTPLSRQNVRLEKDNNGDRSKIVIKQEDLKTNEGSSVHDGDSDVVDVTPLSRQDCRLEKDNSDYHSKVTIKLEDLKTNKRSSVHDEDSDVVDVTPSSRQDCRLEKDNSDEHSKVILKQEDCKTNKLSSVHDGDESKPKDSDVVDEMPLMHISQDCRFEKDNSDNHGKVTIKQEDLKTNEGSSVHEGSSVTDKSQTAVPEQTLLKSDKSLKSSSSKKLSRNVEKTGTASSKEGVCKSKKMKLSDFYLKATSTKVKEPHTTKRKSEDSIGQSENILQAEPPTKKRKSEDLICHSEKVLKARALATTLTVTLPNIMERPNNKPTTSEESNKSETPSELLSQSNVETSKESITKSKKPTELPGENSVQTVSKTNTVLSETHCSKSKKTLKKSGVLETKNVSSEELCSKSKKTVKISPASMTKDVPLKHVSKSKKSMKKSPDCKIKKHGSCKTKISSKRDAPSGISLKISGLPIVLKVATVSDNSAQDHSSVKKNKLSASKKLPNVGKSTTSDKNNGHSKNQLKKMITDKPVASPRVTKGPYNCSSDHLDKDKHSNIKNMIEEVNQVSKGFCSSDHSDKDKYSKDTSMVKEKKHVSKGSPNKDKHSKDKHTVKEKHVSKESCSSGHSNKDKHSKDKTVIKENDHVPKGSRSSVHSDKREHSNNKHAVKEVLKGSNEPKSSVKHQRADHHSKKKIPSLLSLDVSSDDYESKHRHRHERKHGSRRHLHQDRKRTEHHRRSPVRKRRRLEHHLPRKFKVTDYNHGLNSSTSARDDLWQRRMEIEPSIQPISDRIRPKDPRIQSAVYDDRLSNATSDLLPRGSSCHNIQHSDPAICPERPDMPIVKELLDQFSHNPKPTRDNPRWTHDMQQESHTRYEMPHQTETLPQPIVNASIIGIPELPSHLSQHMNHLNQRHAIVASAPHPECEGAMSIPVLQSHRSIDTSHLRPMHQSSAIDPIYQTNSYQTEVYNVGSRDMIPSTFNPLQMGPLSPTFHTATEYPLHHSMSLPTETMDKNTNVIDMDVDESSCDDKYSQSNNEAVDMELAETSLDETNGLSTINEGGNDALVSGDTLDDKITACEKIVLQDAFGGINTQASFMNNPSVCASQPHVTSQIKPSLPSANPSTSAAASPTKKSTNVDTSETSSSKKPESNNKSTLDYLEFFTAKLAATTDKEEIEYLLEQIKQTKLKSLGKSKPSHRDSHSRDRAKEKARKLNRLKAHGPVRLKEVEDVMHINPPSPTKPECMASRLPDQSARKQCTKAIPQEIDPHLPDNDRPCDPRLFVYSSPITRQFVLDEYLKPCPWSPKVKTRHAKGETKPELPLSGPFKKRNLSGEIKTPVSPDQEMALDPVLIKKLKEKRRSNLINKVKYGKNKEQAKVHHEKVSELKQIHDNPYSDISDSEMLPSPSREKRIPETISTKQESESVDSVRTNIDYRKLNKITQRDEPCSQAHIAASRTGTGPILIKETHKRKASSNGDSPTGEVKRARKLSGNTDKRVVVIENVRRHGDAKRARRPSGDTNKPRRPSGNADKNEVMVEKVNQFVERFRDKYSDHKTPHDGHRKIQSCNEHKIDGSVHSEIHVVRDERRVERRDKSEHILSHHASDDHRRDRSKLHRSIDHRYHDGRR